MTEPRWDLVYKWADPETRSLVDRVVSALENCDRKLAEAEARAATPPALDVPTQQRITALEREILNLGGVLGFFEHGVATRSSKPSDPDDVRWECLCGIGGSPERVRRHWAVELADWHAAAEDWSRLSAGATEETA